MELRQLANFRVVVREGGLGRAARRLHLGQPALTKQIHALEREMGAELLTRSAGGVTPTAAGRRLVEMADHLLDYVDGIKPAVQEAASGISGVVSVGISPSLGPALAEHLVSHMGIRFPRLSVNAVEALPMFLSEWVESDRLDVGLMTRWPSDRFVETLDHVDIGAEDVVLVASPAALPPAGEHSRREILRSLPLALTPGFRMLSLQRLESDAAAFTSGPGIDSVHVIPDLVLRGEACSALPVSYVRDHIVAGRIVAAGFDPPLRRDLVAATRSGRRPTAAVRAVVEAARTRLAALDGGSGP